METMVVSAKPVINAKTTYYDVNLGLYVLKDNVYVGWVVIKSSLLNSGIQNRALIEGSVTLTQGDLTIAADNTDFN